jgi:hypothetical protein
MLAIYGWQRRPANFVVPASVNDIDDNALVASGRKISQMPRQLHA